MLAFLLTFDISAGSNVILCRQYELVVKDPFWLVIEASGRMKHDVLVVFNGAIVSLAFKMGHLQERALINEHRRLTGISYLTCMKNPLTSALRMLT